MGFTDNGVTFFASQVTVEDGHLTLRMEKPKVVEKVVQYYEVPEHPQERERHPANYDNSY